MQWFSGFIVRTSVEVLIPKRPLLRRWREEPVNGGAVSDLREVWLRRKGEGGHCGLERTAEHRWIVGVRSAVFHPDDLPFEFLFVPNTSEFDHFMVFKIIYYIAHTVDLLRRGLHTIKGMDIPLYFYQVQNYQPQKNHEVELGSHLQKILDGLHRLNLLQFQGIIFDQIKSWVTSKYNRNCVHLP